ncbi:hypothetical protein HYPBUDRAFT_114457 [Hyphopichia burtonii NRRL Y-1933]|uniref:GATA-type domain-containing protein n=1 Tax=Hyphopichia burtonii NRRL Y-1933 TaxID=984485 RepID=A0A1E4RCS0_9ASCO|nr:hypothetical protein HYPBUDRAFT_114457 [Hyphopichia burtonii NRRL Y-1933]ODV65023.1 hypothetical protein HYPBUDRAFT_114457 [Hyphopichia burtonii NRRL Y-1933]
MSAATFTSIPSISKVNSISSNTSNKIRLPSISELTSNKNISNSPKSTTSPNGYSSVGSPNEYNFKYSIKPLSNDYMLTNASTSANVQKLPSPTLPYEQSNQTNNSPMHSNRQSPTYYTPAYYYQHAPPQPRAMSFQGVPATANASNGSAAAYLPEVINKPTNKCHRCGTTETPEWRRGPNGVRTLCNACGLFHAKLVKRKGAAFAAEEVLNNKVCKGKNGRRISIKKQMLDDNHLSRPQYQSNPIMGHQPHMLPPQPHMLPPPIINPGYSSIPLSHN